MKRIDALTGVRGFAALWVTLFHLLPPIVGRDHIPAFFAGGHLGVDLFFLLSGFVISLVHQQEFARLNLKTTARFLWLRIARMMPTHYVMLGLFVVFYGVKSALGQSSYNAAVCQPLDILYNVLNIHAWGVTDRPSCNFPSWSVSAEWFAYLLFPFLALWFARAGGRRLAATAASGLLALFAARWLLGSDPTHWTVGLGLIRVTLEFTLGCYLYQAYARQTPAPFGASWNAICLASLTLLIALAGRVEGMWLIPVMMVFLLSLAHASGRVAALFDNRVMRHLGEISYSLYMAHAVAVLTAFWLAGKPAWAEALGSYRALLLLPLMALSLLGAQALYALVERPSRQWLRRQWDEGFPAFRPRGAVTQ